MKRFAAIVLFVGVSSVLIWLVWFRQKQEEAEPKKPEAEVPVHVAKITRATLRGYVTGYGNVEPEPTAGARISVGVPGVVATVGCVDGQRVERGALLFELDGRAAEVAVKFAEKTLERQSALAKVEGTSQKLVQEAEQQLATARAQQALLQVRSPIAGMVTKVNVKPGEVADLTTVLAEVMDLKHLLVTFNVSSADLGNLKAGQPTEISTPDSTNIISVALTFISPQLDAKTGSGAARAVLPPETALKPGQFVKVRVVSEEHKDCLAVPAGSVAKDQTGTAFVALVEGEKATLKPVKIGLRDGELIEVEGEGLSTDQTVVTEGAYALVMTQQFATKIRVVSE